MNALLISPELPETFWSLKHFVKIVEKKSSYPPLGLLTVAALLPSEWNKKLVDLNVSPLTDEDLNWADFAFISAMSVQEVSLREVLKRCREKILKIIAGGPLFTFENEYFPEVDHFILNEAEITLPQFLNDLKTGSPKKIYSSTEFADMHQSPIPLFNLVDANQYLNAIIQYSRGCPFSCEFCDVPAIYGKKPRTKSPEQVIAELEIIDRENIAGQVFFADDNLIGNKKNLKQELLPALIDWRKRTKSSLSFITQLTINLADDEELMQLLSTAGFRQVFIGIETPNQDSLMAAHKTQNLFRNILNSIDKIQQSGFIISAGFIVGFDTDKQNIFQLQKEFIRQSKIAFPNINILKAPPGTVLYKKMKESNRLKPRTFYSESSTNIIPLMNEDDLYKGYAELLAEVYSPAVSYERISNFLKIFKLPENNGKSKENFLRRFYLLLKIIYHIGYKSETRKYFWKLILKTFFRNYKLIKVAVSQGIMIHQMYLTSKHIISEIPSNKKMDVKEPKMLYSFNTA